MKHANKIEKLRQNDGSLPKYAFPGGYEILYIAADNAVICNECANGENGSECQSVDPDYQDDPQWKLIEYFVHWEGDPEYCEHCNRSIESEYGSVKE